MAESLSCLLCVYSPRRDCSGYEGKGGQLGLVIASNCFLWCIYTSIRRHMQQRDTTCYMLLVLYPCAGPRAVCMCC